MKRLYITLSLFACLFVFTAVVATTDGGPLFANSITPTEVASWDVPTGGHFGTDGFTWAG